MQYLHDTLGTGVFWANDRYWATPYVIQRKGIQGYLKNFI